MSNFLRLTNPEAIEQLKKFFDDAKQALRQAENAAHSATLAALEVKRPDAKEVKDALDAASAARMAASDALVCTNQMQNTLDALAYAVRACHSAAEDAVKKTETALSAATAAEQAGALVAALEAVP